MATAVVLASGVLNATSPVLGVAVPPAHLAVEMPSDVMAPAVWSEPLDRPLSGFVKSVYRGLRTSYRILTRMFWRALDWWGSWLKSALFSLSVAMLAALADGGLMTAWRAEGLRALVTYSTLMLYVYGRLLFSSGVHLAPKLLFLGAILYGMIRRDLVPDRSLVPGRIEDIVLIVIATRAFMYACPEELVNEYAERAVTLKRRVQSW